jgi:hypothetical protein
MWKHAEWAARALQNAAERVRGTAAGGRDKALLAAACSVAPYVTGGWLSEAEVRATLAAAAAAAGHTDRVDRTITSGLQRAALEEAWWPQEGSSVVTTTFRWRGHMLRCAHKVGAALEPAEVAQIVDLSGIELPLGAASGGFDVTVYPGVKKTQGQPQRARWADWAGQAADPDPWPTAGKNALPLWAPHKIENDSRGQVPEGVIATSGVEAFRAPIVHAVTALVLDYDDEPAFSMDALRAWWPDVQWVAHTSASHMLAKKDKAAHGRGRLVLALSRPVTEGEYGLLAEWTLQQLPKRGRAGELELRNARRAYYVPSRAPGGYETAAQLSGRAIDVDALLRAVRAAMDGVQDAVDDASPQVDVWELLDTTTDDNGKERASGHLNNIATVLRQDSRWAGRLTYDAFWDRLQLDGAPLRDGDVTRLRHWLGEVYSMRAGKETAHDVVQMVCEENETHELRDWLDGLPAWDGKPRAVPMLRDYFGCQGDAELIDWYSSCFLVAMVARAFQPGCKHDVVLIIRGDQGAGKSTGLRALCGEQWFGDSNLPIGEEEAYRRIQGCWLWELSELQGMRKREAEELKSFLASQSDTYRMPYARQKVTRPRLTCFAGTTNADAFLEDPTGHRRFWVVTSTRVDVEGLREDREMIWAEAVALYRGGAAWNLPPELWARSAEIAADHETAHPWRAVIEEWLVGRGPVTTQAVLESALERAPGTWRKADANVVAGILRQLGRKRRRMTSGRREWVWE